jgi:SARP family transcriptional regulator, regulator of embCAB operon
MDGSRLGFGLLGPLLLTVGATPVALGTPKQRAVLAVLLINRNRAVGADSLVNAAWEETPAPAVRASIHSYVSNLRRILGSADVDPHAVLASAPPGYRLNVGDSDCDLDRFVAKKTAGIHAAAAGQFEQASSRLSEALAEWRGPVLDDLRDFAFVEVFATALMEDYVSAHTARAEAEIACGRGYAVIGELEELAAGRPYHEPLWAQLITAYYVAERQSEALEAYRRLKTVLAEDLGIDPGPTVESLHMRILRQERLDTKQVAKTTAARTLTTAHTAFVRQSAVAGLRDAAGRHYPLQAPATRIGRLADNDIVLNDDEVSRYHAVIIDTGSSFMITDLRSFNGVSVEGRRLHPSAALADGDRIRICGHAFTFELQRR